MTAGSRDGRWLTFVLALLAVGALVTTMLVVAASDRTNAVQALRSTIEVLQRDFDPARGYVIDRARIADEVPGIEIVRGDATLSAGDEGKVIVTLAGDGSSLLLATVEGNSCHRQRRDMRPAPRDAYSVEPLGEGRPCDAGK